VASPHLQATVNSARHLHRVMITLAWPPTRDQAPATPIM
jgi:hypothetical protein